MRFISFTVALFFATFSLGACEASGTPDQSGTGIGVKPTTPTDQDTDKKTNFSNPVLNMNAPDPTIWKDGANFYQMNSGAKKIRTSTDMVHWTNKTKTIYEVYTEEAYAEALKLTPGAEFWAPDVTKIGDKWMLYLTCHVSDIDAKIAAFSSDCPYGPFQFEGKITDGNVTGIKDTIDPEVVQDPATGKVWLFFGSIGKVHRVELNSTGTALANPDKPEYIHVAGIKVEDDNTGRTKVFEGTYLYYRNGYWYLFASSCQYWNWTYKMVVGRSKTLEGDFVDKNGKLMKEGNGTVILSSGKNDHFYGPGHNGEIFTDKRGNDYIFYHAHNTDIEGDQNRTTSLQRIYWDDEGWPYFKDGKPAEVELAPKL